MKVFDNRADYQQDTTSYLPKFFRLTDEKSIKELNHFVEKVPKITVIDDITSQLQELIKCLNPSRKIKTEEYPELIASYLNGRDIDTYGVWVYYPWSNKLIHLLDEEEFVEVRTNRNRYKLTKEEQEALKQKKIGVIGLSVGQSIALTLAIERTCGELRLADFDTAELSNLNRIRTGVHNLGLKKTIIAAREIAEIDPFLKVKIYNEGIVKENIDEFFGQGENKLDILIEVCDGLDIKIESRFKARSLGIPVVMDTNDRGMLDVERFDLEPERAILHGLAEGLDPENIKGLTNEEKIPYILKMVGIEQISTRLKASMMEVEQSINTWPQLASSVALGGAITTDICRRILLDQHHDSGRYYIDLDELIPEKAEYLFKENQALTIDPHADNPYTPLRKEVMQECVHTYLNGLDEDMRNAKYLPNDEQLERISDAIVASPSAGNNQPWKVWCEGGRLFLFHDKYRSYSWGDYYEMGSHMGLGTVLENVHLQSLQMGLEDNIVKFPVTNNPQFIAAIEFKPLQTEPIERERNLAAGLFRRCTNRRLGPRRPLPQGLFEELNTLTQEFPGYHIWHTEDPDQLDVVGEVISACDRIRLLQPKGHSEFYSEVRWDKEHALATLDGIELAAVDVTEGEKAGFRVARDWKAVELLSKWDKGTAFKKASTKSVNSASSMLLLTAPEFTHNSLLDTGRLVQRLWIHLNNRGVSIHPMLSPAFFFNRLIHGNGLEIPEHTQKELYELRAKFTSVFPLNDQDREVFIMKLSIADNMEARSLRLPKSQIILKPNA
jgi:hypothetical protein